MLETRATYGYYGDGHGYTGEGTAYTTKRMHYSRYKKYYSNYRTCDYDKNTKEITVYIPCDEYKEYSNEGNRYQFTEYTFTGLELDRYYRDIEAGMTEEESRKCCTYKYDFKAKSYENALRNCKKYFKDNNIKLIEELAEA